MNQKLVKPFLRGHFHQAAFFLSVGACAVLIALSQGMKALSGSIIYTIGVAGLFGISALYHRPTWGPKMRLWMKRLDHCAIFVMIAATSTPIALLGMDEQSGTTLLKILWTAAFVGILQSLFWVTAPKWVSAIFYIGMGWLVTPYFGEMSVALGPTRVALILVGGIVYTLGAIIYAAKRPNPYPKVFGYHEIFHLLVVIAAVIHFIVIYQLIRGSHL